MKDVHIVGKKMARTGPKTAKTFSVSFRISLYFVSYSISVPKIFIASNWVGRIGNRTMSFLLSDTNGIMLTLGYVIWMIE